MLLKVSQHISGVESFETESWCCGKKPFELVSAVLTLIGHYFYNVMVLHQASRAVLQRTFLFMTDAMYLQYSFYKDSNFHGVLFFSPKCIIHTLSFLIMLSSRERESNHSAFGAQK